MVDISNKASEQLKNLTQSEAWELVRQIELKFGVRPATQAGKVVVTYGDPVVGRAVVFPSSYYSLVTPPGLATTRVFQGSSIASVAEAAKIQSEALVSKVTTPEVENRSLVGESVITELCDLDNSETLINEIDNLLGDISGSDERIKIYQASIDSLKIETKEMLATLHAMID